VLKMLPAPELATAYVIGLAKAGRIDEAIPHVQRLRVFAGSGYPLLRDSILDQTRDLGPETARLRHALREPLP
jgi:hypothetical protein